MKHANLTVDIFKIQLTDHLSKGHPAEPESVENLITTSILISDQLITKIEEEVAKANAKAAKEKAESHQKKP